MTQMGEAALDLPFPLAHDDVVFVVAYHNRGHESFLPRASYLLVPGCAERLAQLVESLHDEPQPPRPAPRAIAPAEPVREAPKTVDDQVEDAVVEPPPAPIPAAPKPIAEASAESPQPEKSTEPADKPVSATARPAEPASATGPAAAKPAPEKKDSAVVGPAVVAPAPVLDAPPPDEEEANQKTIRLPDDPGVDPDDADRVEPQRFRLF